MFVAVARLGDLREGRPQPVRVRQREVVIIRWRGSVYATRAVCPHQQASLARGSVKPRIAGGEELGQLLLKADDPVLVCPWHAWGFSLRTGVCLTDPSLRVRRYETRVRDGVVELDLDGRPRPAAAPGHEGGG